MSEKVKISTKKYFSVFAVIFLLANKAFAYQEENPVSLQSFVIIDSLAILEKVIPHDINQDGHTDLVFQQIFNKNSPGDKKIDIKYIKGTENGLDFNNAFTLRSASDISNFFLSDWNNDGDTDLIFTKTRKEENGSTYNDIIEIQLLSKTVTQNIITFRVPYAVYLGDTTNAKELNEIKDMDLDGFPDMILIGFSHVTIGWNNKGGEPEFDEITNFGFNTYSSKILDYNQDGYPDFINDDQYWKEPVIHENNRNRTFTRKSVKLPKWSFSDESSLYWNFEPLWLNEDKFPDLMVQKTNQGLTNATYIIYEFEESSNSFIESDLQIESNDLGLLSPFHFNNDGFTDLIEIREGGLRLRISDQNNSFSSFPINFETGYELKNIFKLDTDKDGDLEVLFSFNNGDLLYQASNELLLNNERPSSVSFNYIYEQENSLTTSWAPSSDIESSEGHIEYLISVISEKDSISINTNSTYLNILNLPKGTYHVNIKALDPLGLYSESAVSEPLVITSNFQESLPFNFNLYQNYPNPFNPTTTIQFELDKSTFTKLAVYDVLGRKVQELVNEIRPAGTNTIEFNATNLASGVYLYRLEANGVVQTKRLTLIK
ncbi:MAG: T9SS type A sorting domain-containing protein [Balneola sp.]